jgi:hypothetical protein
MRSKNWHFLEDFKTRQIIFILALVASFVILLSLWFFQTSRALKNLKKEISQTKIPPSGGLFYLKEELSRFRQLLELNFEEIQDLKRKLEENLK